MQQKRSLYAVHLLYPDNNNVLIKSASRSRSADPHEFTCRATSSVERMHVSLRLWGKMDYPYVTAVVSPGAKITQEMREMGSQLGTYGRKKAESNESKFWEVR